MGATKDGSSGRSLPARRPSLAAWHALGLQEEPTYWAESKPYPDEIRGIVVLDDAAALPAFQAKQLDVMYNLPLEQANDIRRANPAAPMLKWLSPMPPIYACPRRRGRSPPATSR